MQTIFKTTGLAALAFVAAVAGSSGVMAADLGKHVKAAPAAAAEVPAEATVNWTGLYIGLDGTAGSGSSNWATFFSGEPNFATAGGLFGAHVGMLRQMDHLVLGWEASAAGGGFSGSGDCPDSGETCKTKLDGLEALRGKLGFAAGRMLVYGTGGLAWDQATHEEWCNCVAGGGSNLWATTGEQTKRGWVLGAGLEAALTSRLSLGAEYLHYDFGSHTADLDLDGNNQDTATYHDRLDVAELRLSYKLVGPGDRDGHVPLK